MVRLPVLGKNRTRFDIRRARVHPPENAAETLALRKPRFDGTITLGHVIQLLAMGCACLTMFVSFRDSVRDLDARVTFLERSQGSVAAAVEKLAENQSQLARTSDRLSFAIEVISKKLP